MLIDTHCHLSLDDLKLQEKIDEMKDHIMIVSGCDSKSNKEVMELIKNDNIYGTIGFHPECVEKLTDKDYEELEEYLSNPKIVGVGEIGLDYHYTKENKDLQIKHFIKQIKLAKKYNKTVVIHSRDAANDTLEIIEKHLKNHKFVMHCYSYSLEIANILKEYDMKFGIGGVLTFKNGVKLKEVVKNIPLDKLVLETDSPYLAPVPFRGEENRPINVYYVAKEMAYLKEISFDEILKITKENAVKQFDLKV